MNAQDRWVLLDFEYAGIGAFADDLAGAEVRLEQSRYPHLEGFLAGQSIRGTLAACEPVRFAYKAYNLLAILTYRLSHLGVVSWPCLTTAPARLHPGACGAGTQSDQSPAAT